MKRTVSIICLLTLICLSFVSCNTGASDDVYSKLNKLMDSSVYNYLEVTVTTTIDAQTELNSTYTYTKSDGGLKIEYSVENLGQFEQVGGAWVAPDEMITTAVGNVTVKDGAIVSSEGDDAPFDMKDAALPHFDFKEVYFKSPVSEDGHFTASVLSPGAFMGTYSPCSAMTVDVLYHEFTITDILLTYVSPEGNVVEAKYEYR